MESDYILVWGEKVSLLVIDAFSQSFIHYTQFPWNQINDSVIFLNNQTYLQAYISKKDYEKLKKAHPAYFLKKENINSILKKYEELISNFNRFVEKINQTDFSSYERKELLPFFEEYKKQLLEVCAYFRATRPEAEIEAEKILKERLALYYKSKEEIENKFHILIESPEPDTLKEENIAWLKIAESRGVTDRQLSAHAKFFSDFFINTYNGDEVISLLKKRLEETKENFKERQREAKNSMEKLKSLKKEQKKIVDRCEDKLIRDYASMYQKFGVYRFKLKPCWAGIEFLSLSLLDRISLLIGISTEEMCNTFTFEDILNFLESGEKLQEKVIEERKKCVVYIIKNKKQRIIQGHDALEFIKKLVEKNMSEYDEIKGTIANGGIWRGIVYKVPSTNLHDLLKHAEKFQKGNILITDMTQPNMVIIMKKAGAIVTNQGGLTSHAAIMSREFGIPCIVGTLKATKILKDGDYIEVDANKGIVKILKRKK